MPLPSLMGGLSLVAPSFAHRPHTPLRLLTGPTARCARSRRRQVEELQRAAGEMVVGVDGCKSYFAEEAKLSAEEFFSRWAQFLAQLDTAIANQQADLKRAAAAAAGGRRR